MSADPVAFSLRPPSLSPSITTAADTHSRQYRRQWDSAVTAEMSQLPMHSGLHSARSAHHMAGGAHEWGGGLGQRVGAGDGVCVCVLRGAG